MHIKQLIQSRATRARVFGVGVAVAAGVAVTLAGSTGASAAGSVVQPLNASGCGSAPGPGTWNTSCISVSGSGLYVGSVEGSLTSTTAPYFPQDVCDVTVHVWGTWQSGASYNVRATNTGCGLGEIGEVFYPQGNFRNGSSLCEQTEYSGQWSTAKCVTIHA
jgi:hypothetical protein